MNELKMFGFSCFCFGGSICNTNSVMNFDEYSYILYVPIINTKSKTKPNQTNPIIF